MALPRVVAPETLDGLEPDDPDARRSRRDLQRVHRAMGSRAILRRAWRELLPDAAGAGAGPLRVLELGAGDGTLLLGVARSLGRSGRAVELTLLDRQPLLDAATKAAYAAVGWQAVAAVVDVHDWVAGSGQGDAAPTAADPAAVTGRRWDLVVANLFLHHFEGPALAALLGAVAARSDRFFACEPRRNRLALAGSHLVGALGANVVTREDAVLSVHAGFSGSELTASWPTASGWRLREYPAGLFSHCFRAERSALATP